MNTRSKKNKSRKGEQGFTLIETSIGLVIMLVVTLGSASLFAYAVRNNNGGQDRAQALAIAQTALETLRNARFTVTTTDPILQATPAAPAPQTVYRENRPYTVIARIDDVPPAIAGAPTTLKTITLTVIPQKAGSIWASQPVTIVTQRARSEQP